MKPVEWTEENSKSILTSEIIHMMRRSNGIFHCAYLNLFETLPNPVRDLEYD